MECKKKDIQNGFSLRREAIGNDYGVAIARARLLNSHLDAWRAGRGEDRSLDIGAKFGTVDWWIETYVQSAAFEKLSERTKRSYRYQLRCLTDLVLKNGVRLGKQFCKSFTARGADAVYKRLKGGQSGKKFRTANLTTDIAKCAWRVVQRTHPKEFVSSNPFVGLSRTHKTSSVRHATREEVYRLSEAIESYGHPHLALVPLICFEWHQRPENVLAGSLRWTDYRPAERPNEVRILHHKTGEEVWIPLEGQNGKLFYPELEVRLAETQRLGIPIVLTNKRGPSRPYSASYARRIVREAAHAAGIPEHVRMTATRHGGLTELGDAELTEQEEMSLSGHRSPDVIRRYVKRTKTQRLSAARKRREWVEKEHVRNESQNDHSPKESERKK